MRWVHGLWCGLAMLALAASPVAAQFYVGGHGGISIQQDSDLEDPAFPALGVTSFEVEFDAGPLFGFVAGYDFGNFRAEGEVTYRTNDIDDVVINGTAVAGLPGVTLDGDVTSWAIMANGYYDIDTGTIVTPYIGGGIGVQIVEADLRVTALGVTATADETDAVFAGQIAAGLAVEVMPKLDITVDYRFLISSDPDFDGTEAENTNHSIRAGVRYTF